MANDQLEEAPIRSEEGVTEGQVVRLRDSGGLAVVQYDEIGVSHPKMPRRHWNLHLMAGGSRWYESARDIRKASILLVETAWPKRTS